MPMSATVSAAGTGPLVHVNVAPFIRENLSVRGSIVEILAAGVLKFSTDARMRMSHLLALDTTGSLDYRAAAVDTNGMWSEWSGMRSIAASNFTAGATDVSIASGATSSLEIDEPSVLFPDLSRGTGQVYTFKTIVSEGFPNEVRRSEWADGICVFNVVLLDLDAYQIALIQKFYSDLNGSFRPFYFIYADQFTGIESKYIVRFRDNPSNDLLRVDRGDIRLSLVEMPRTGGGDV